MMFRDMIADYSQNNAEFNNTLRRENAQLLNVKVYRVTNIMFLDTIHRPV
jgi:hypothetical protein